MKDNFLLKKSQQEVFKGLSNEDAGILIKGIFDYVNTGDSGLEGYLLIIFLPIKNEIDKNEEKYKKRCEINKENGARGGAPKGNKNAKQPKTTERLKIQPKTSKNNMIYHNHDHIHDHVHISSITKKDNKVNRGMGEEEKEEKKETDDVSLLTEISKKVIEHLNKTTKSNFRYGTKSTLTKIKARLNEGYTLDDFIVVIDKKSNEWIGTEFEKYLCPETLFGNKFEKYLNQKTTSKKTNDEQWDFLKGVYDGTIEIN